jgi:hypothetical protein
MYMNVRSAPAGIPDSSTDPTEVLSSQLGLDPAFLSHNTGLRGNDARGALARLRFALAHPATHVTGNVHMAPHHQASTEAATLKKRERPVVSMFAVPTPRSPHLQQVSVLSELLRDAPLECLKLDSRNSIAMIQHSDSVRCAG